MTSPKIHPAAEVFPLLEGDAFNELVEDIRVNGQIEPIVTMGEDDELTILDGRNRFRACEAAGVAPRFTPYQGDDPVAFVISKNLRRRDLTSDQRAAIASDLATIARGGDRRSEEFSNRRGGGLKGDAPMTKAEASKKMGISKRRTERAATVAKQAPELHAKVKAGEVTLAEAEKQVKQRAPRGSVKAAREEKKRAKAAAQEKLMEKLETRTAECRALLQEAAQVLRASQQFGQDQKKLKRLIDVFSDESAPLPLFNPAHEFAEALFESSDLPKDDPEDEDEGKAQVPSQEAQDAQGEPEATDEVTPYQNQTEDAPPQDRAADAEPDDWPEPKLSISPSAPHFEALGVAPALAERMVDIRQIRSEEAAVLLAALPLKVQADLATRTDRTIIAHVKKLRAAKRGAAE